MFIFVAPVLCVSTQGLEIESVARAKAGGHATADGKEMAAVPCTLLRRGQRMLLLVRRRTRQPWTAGRKRPPRPTPRGVGGLSLLPAEEACRVTVDNQRSKEGRCALRVLAQGKKEKVMT